MPVRHAMLGLLYWKPMHGYLLRQNAQEYAWIYPMSNTNVYPALHSLEKEGFVCFESQIHDGRARKVYSITEAGVGELFTWLTSKTEEKLTFRDTLLLKISMMEEEAMAHAAPWLEQVATSLENDIANAEYELKSRPERSRYAMLTMEYGVDLLRIRLNFLRKVITTREEIGAVSS